MAGDPLERYRAKRDFSATPEPAPKVRARRAGKPVFVVQKHWARRLHHDFRLEIDGVLASWAVTRGPSPDPATKRLAVRTEDHPRAYGAFEGVIPQGHYGAGTVMLWDRGWYEFVPAPGAADASAGLAQGKLHIRLHGARMRGEWALVRTRGRPGDRGESWLLMKIRDDEAGAADALEGHVTSVASGRTMEAIRAGKAAVVKPRGRALPAPGFRPLQLAQLVALPPDADGWLHEIKHDGYRALVAIGGGAAQVFTRGGLDWTARFSAVAEALARLPVRSALIDGEMVVQDEAGRSRFGMLQQALSEGRDNDIRFIGFDLLELDGKSLEALPLVARKAQLRPLLAGGARFIFSDHVDGAGGALFREACAMGLEGIVSKKADAPYHGKRSGAWLKVKCVQRERLEVVGWLPSGAGRGFRSLLLGRQTDSGLVYAGKVGTGFDAAALEALSARLDSLATDSARVEAPCKDVRGARWVKPGLAGEVAYAEVTNEGVLRHASWLGVADAGPPPEPAANLPRISNRDRVIFPEAGVTKGELADYYARMAGPLLATAGNRYLSLVRCPAGRQKKCFFQKHAGEGFEGVKSSAPDAKGKRWLYVDDAEGVMRCVQMGTIEFHGWGARADRPGHPDRLVIDLDPDEGLDFEPLLGAALEMRDQLAALGLVSFAMLSGGKGVHVVAPLDAGADWAAVKDFAQRFARAMAAAHPERYTAELSKAKRKGRIFIDWLRNQEGATAVMPWSVRARAGAPVAVPVGWEELRALKGPQPFALRDGTALAARATAMTGWGVAVQRLPEA